MSSLNKAMHEYKIQLQKGEIITAYQGLMAYFNSLRNHFQKAYSHYKVPTNIYYGYMDMTYFAIIPETFQERDLKVALVFPHQEFRFEAWLAARNKKVQAKVWEAIRDSGWTKYPLVPQGKGVDGILYHVLADDPDFSDLPALTRKIESGTLAFIKELEGFLPQLDRFL
jgi:hypothetical protein